MIGTCICVMMLMTAAVIDRRVKGRQQGFFSVVSVTLW